MEKFEWQDNNYIHLNKLAEGEKTASSWSERLQRDGRTCKCVLPLFFAVYARRDAGSPAKSKLGLLSEV